MTDDIKEVVEWLEKKAEIRQRIADEWRSAGWSWLSDSAERDVRICRYAAKLIREAYGNG